MSIFDDIFDDIEKMFKKMRGREGVSSGYSISVTYGPDGKPIVNVETYGDVDKESLKKEIERQYPGAEIRGLGDELIWETAGEETKLKDKMKHVKRRRDKLGPTEIREVEE